MKKTTLLMLSVMLLAGCATTKQTNQTNETEIMSAQKAKRVQTAMPTRNEVDYIIDAQPVFTSMSSTKANFKIDYPSAGNNSIFSLIPKSFNGAVSMIPDSAIIFSVQPILSIELYRLELTPQEITFIDKMNKKYVKMNYEQLAQHSGIALSFAEIQAVAMNRIFMTGTTQNDLNNRNPQITIQDEQSLISFTDNEITYIFTADEQTKQLNRTQLAKLDQSFTADVSYLNHSAISNVIFPAEISFGFSSGKQSGSLTISFQQLNFNGKVNVAPLNISKYTVSPLSEYIK